MNKFIDRYLLPFIITVVCAWLIRLSNIFLTSQSGTLRVLVSIITALALFALGISLQSKRHYKTWLKKLIIAFVFSYLVIYNLGYFRWSLLIRLFDLLALQQLGFYMIYVIMGWLFFD